MSNYIKCFDVVSMVVNEATSQFAPLCKINEEKYEILKQYCEVIDSLVVEFDGESLDVEIDDIEMTITIKIECQDIVIKSQNHNFYSLAQRAIEFGFSATEEGLLCAKFVFPSVWDRA